MNVITLGLIQRCPVARGIKLIRRETGLHDPCLVSLLTIRLLLFALRCASNPAPAPRLAQVKPVSSGQPSFYEPQMKRTGSGVYHPNSEQTMSSNPARRAIDRTVLPVPRLKTRNGSSTDLCRHRGFERAHPPS